MKILATGDIQGVLWHNAILIIPTIGYMVLASIVEKVTGTGFGAFLKKNIFDPLEMRDSFVYSFENDNIKTNQLTGYRLYRGWRHLKIGGTVNDAIVDTANSGPTLTTELKAIVMYPNI